MVQSRICQGSPPPLIVGLTGGIASGKSTVSRSFVAHGAVLIDADQVAREVVAPGSPGLRAVVAEFGTQIRFADGALDRKALGALVFSDAAALRRLEVLLHPLIRARIAERVVALRLHAPPVILIDAALLVEMELHQVCDLVIVVYCGVERQLARIMARDGLDAARANQRLAAQTDDLTRLAVADYTIDNQGSLQELEAHVTALWQRLRAQEAGDAEPI